MGFNVCFIEQITAFYFSLFPLRLAVFRKATNGFCVVLPAAHRLSLCQTLRFSYTAVTLDAYVCSRMAVLRVGCVHQHPRAEFGVRHGAGQVE